MGVAVIPGISGVTHVSGPYRRALVAERLEQLSQRTGGASGIIKIPAVRFCRDSELLVVWAMCQ
jgi:hypothetical protein